MRASSGAILGIVFISACGASTSSSPPSEAGAPGLSDAYIPMPDGRVSLGGDGAVAKMLYGVGEQCVHSSDCMSNNCNHDSDGFPGGYCVQDCGPGRYGPQPCPMGSSCTILNADTPTCYATCTSNTDCRTGYTCLDIGAKLTQSGGSMVCWPQMTPPNCNVDADCPPSMPHCTGGYNAAEAGAGDGGDDGGPPMPGQGNCGP